MRHLPPLNSIRAFEAAARHESFRKAADELSVTPAAVSQQVKTLEDWLGVQLFQRLPRGLVLTRAGRDYLPRLTDALDRLSAATNDICAYNSDNILTISVTPGFASLWLAPRVWSFANEHPELDVRIAASARSPESAQAEHDLAIRYGRGRFPGFSSELLLRDGITPVCAPELARGEDGLRVPSDLRRHTLLYNDSAVVAGFHSSWQDWLKIAGIEPFARQRSLHYSDFHLVMQEAIAGRGVALGHIALIGDELRSGRLVKPFEQVLDSGGDYYVVYPVGAEQTPRVAVFLAWLREQVKNYYNVLGERPRRRSHDVR